MGLTVYRQKKVYFYPQPTKIHSLINRRNAQGISNLTTSADLHRLLALSKNLLTGKTS